MKFWPRSRSQRYSKFIPPLGVLLELRLFTRHQELATIRHVVLNQDSVIELAGIQRSMGSLQGDGSREVLRMAAM